MIAPALYHCFHMGQVGMQPYIGWIPEATDGSYWDGRTAFEPMIRVGSDPTLDATTKPEFAEDATAQLMLVNYRKFFTSLRFKSIEVKFSCKD